MKKILTNFQHAMQTCPGKTSDCVVLTDDGLIEGIGSYRDLKNKSFEELDLDGKFLMPAFIDNHIHPIQGGTTKMTLDFRNVKSKAEFLRNIMEYAAKLPESAWVKGRNWHAESWEDGHPYRQDLDSVCGGRPAVLHRMDGHLALANTKALHLAGIDENTPDPPGGKISRDSKGQPDGILKESAMGLLRKVVPPLTEAEIERTFQMTCEESGRSGIASAHAIVTIQHFELLLKLSRKTDLTCRFSCYVGLWEDDLEKQLEYIMELKKTTRDNKFVRLLGLKFFYDGSLGSKTAYMREAYPYNPEYGHDYHGIKCAHDIGRFKREISESLKKGIQTAIHAIGDQAIHDVLDIYSAIPNESIRASRPRIEHCQHLLDEDLDRFAGLGVLASVQPRHISLDAGFCESVIGAERARKTIMIRSLIDNGAKVSFGSDWPVVEMNPILGLSSAVTRESGSSIFPDGWIPEQKISAEEALLAFTEGSAFAEFSENKKGRIAPGFYADFAVLSQNPAKCSPSEIKDIKIIKTLVAGR